MTIARYLCFFPSITFGIIEAEVFPYALLYSVLHFYRINIKVFLFIFLLLFSAFYGVFNSNQSNIYGELLRSLLAYLNPLLIFAVILRLPESEYSKFLYALRHVFIFMCVLSIVQFSNLFGFLDPALKALVPRSSATSLGHRGITLLATEPARASIEFIFMYLVVRFFWLPKNIINYTDIAIAIILVFVFKSATSMFIYVAFLTFFNRLLLWTAVPITIYLIAENASFVSGRAAYLITNLSNLSFGDAIFFIIDTSGNRVISIISAVQYGLYFPFGGGIGNWKQTSIEALFLTGFDYSTLRYFNAEWKEGTLYFRASGYMMNLMMDVGIIGVTAATALLMYLTKSYRKYSRNKFHVFLLFLLNVFFVGSVGTPVAWIATAIILRAPEATFGRYNRFADPSAVKY